MSEQNFSHHSKLVPAFHFFVLPMLTVNLVQSILLWKRSSFSIGGLIWVLTSLAIFMVPLLARMMALKAQDRVIRLEERMRFAQILPADLQPRIAEFTGDQLIALRFASDGELPELCRKVLAEKLTNRKAIKQQIKVWRPDHFRV